MTVDEVTVRVRETTPQLFSFEVSRSDGELLFQFFLTIERVIFHRPSLTQLMAERFGGIWEAPEPASQGVIRLVRR